MISAGTRQIHSGNEATEGESGSNRTGFSYFNCTSVSSINRINGNH